MQMTRHWLDREANLRQRAEEEKRAIEAARKFRERNIRTRDERLRYEIDFGIRKEQPKCS